MTALMRAACHSNTAMECGTLVSPAELGTCFVSASLVAARGCRTAAEPEATAALLDACASVSSHALAGLAGCSNPALPPGMQEMSKAKEGKAKATPWGSGYGRAPEILHGAPVPRGEGGPQHLQTRGPMPCIAASSACSSPVFSRRAAFTWADERVQGYASPAFFPTACLPAGYSKKVKGKTAEERLDMRAAIKADKFCK